MLNMFASMRVDQHSLAVYASVTAVGVCSVLLYLYARRSRRKAALQKIVDIKLKKIQDKKAELTEKLKTTDENLLKKRAQIVALPIEELLKELQTGDLRAVEVLQAFQAKTLEADRKTNCVTEFVWEAEEWAKELDWMKTAKGPLHGLPISIKENFFQKGYDSSIGLVKFLNLPMTEDAPTIQALKQLGAVPFVRTNVPQTLLSFSCSNPVFGETKNPRGADRTPGGSSGGEAALISLQGSIVGLASDIGGSIRIPAHMCGIYGLKPTHERIPEHGSKRSLTGIQGLVGVHGFLARDSDVLITVCKAVFPVLYQLDPALAPVPFNEQVLLGTSPLRIGYYTDDKFFPPTPGCQRAVSVAKKALEQRGHSLYQFDVEGVHDAFTNIYKLLGAGASNQLSSYWNDELIDSRALLQSRMNQVPNVVKKLLALFVKHMSPRTATILQNMGCRGIDLWNSMKLRQDHIARFMKAWKDANIDILIGPGFSIPACKPALASKLNPAAMTTMLYNYLDLPAGSVPVTVETDSDQTALEQYSTEGDVIFRVAKQAARGAVGQPLGVQVIGMPFQDELILRVMKEIQLGLRAADK